MVLTKLGADRVTIGDTTIDCQKIEMKPPGFSGMFWKAYYWFNRDTGDFVKYQGLKGPPGSPEFIIESVL